VDLVDAVGGLWIDIPFGVHDPHAPPDGRTSSSLNFQAGRQLIYERALEYAPHAPPGLTTAGCGGSSGSSRAMARELDPIAMLPRAPVDFGTTCGRPSVPTRSRTGPLAARSMKQNVQYYCSGPGHARSA
jgi:hypothetical protein